jgi:tetratricopeptide (TPR) repeat protein
MTCSPKPLLCCLLLLLFGAGRQARAQKRIPDPAAQELNNYLNAAQAALDKHDFQTAAENYRNYLAKKPDDAIVHYDLGYIYSALNRPDDAKSEYQRAIELDPKMSAAYLNLGLTILNTDPASAVSPLQKAAELAPQDARTKLLLGTALEKSGRMPEAIQQYQAAKALDDKDVETRLLLAGALLAVQRLPDAETQYRAALTLQASAQEMAQAHNGLVKTLLAEKKFPEASDELAQYLASYPNDAKARVDHASLLFDLDKPDEALAELDRAAKSAPEDLPALKLRADIIWKQKRYADAVLALQRAEAVAPDDAGIAARLGEAYLQTKDYPDATRWLAASYHLAPNANDVLAYLVDAEYGSKNYPEALAAVDELSRREQLPPASWYVRAACYDNLGRLDEALDAYRKFLQLNKDENSDMYFVSTARVRVLTRELQNKKR